MNAEIKVGDLVVVTKPRLCCGEASGVGKVFRVGGMHKGSNCYRCGNRYDATVAEVDGSFVSCELPRLKRIPPLGELESEKRDENLKEPA